MMRILTTMVFIFGGACAICSSLWHMGNTALFVYHAQKVPALVVDVSERPFESTLEMLENGNMPWGGNTAYHPHLLYHLFGRPITDTSIPDLDNRDFSVGQQVTLLLHPQRPHLRHIDDPKFLWIGDLLLLVCGVIMALVACCMLRRGSKRRAPAQSHAPDPVDKSPGNEAPAAVPARKRKRKASSSRRTEVRAPSKRAASPKKRKRKSATP